MKGKVVQGRFTLYML